jgi:hypothetical protein
VGYFLERLALCLLLMLASVLATAELQKTGRFSTMSPQVDADEHSIEVHTYNYSVFSNKLTDKVN